MTFWGLYNPTIIEEVNFFWLGYSAPNEIYQAPGGSERAAGARLGARLGGARSPRRKGQEGTSCCFL